MNTMIESQIADGCKRSLIGEGMGAYQEWLIGIKKDEYDWPGKEHGVTKQTFLQIAEAELAKYFQRITRPFEEVL